MSLSAEHEHRYFISDWNKWDLTPKGKNIRHCACGDWMHINDIRSDGRRKDEAQVPARQVADCASQPEGEGGLVRCPRPFGISRKRKGFSKVLEPLVFGSLALEANAVSI